MLMLAGYGSLGASGPGILPGAYGSQFTTIPSGPDNAPQVTTIAPPLTVSPTFGGQYGLPVANAAAAVVPDSGGLLKVLVPVALIVGAVWFFTRRKRR